MDSPSPEMNGVTLAASMMGKISKAVGVEIPTNDLVTLVTLFTKMVTKKEDTSTTSSTSKKGEQECKECLDEVGVLNLLTQISKKELEKDDAITTLKMELKRQYIEQRRQSTHLRELEKQLTEDESAREVVGKRIETYRKDPSAGESGFDQYITDLQTDVRLSTSIVAKEMEIYKEKKRCIISPSVKRLEDMLLTLIQ